MRLIYNIFIFIYLLLIKVAALFNQKARLWVDGRKNIRYTIRQIDSGNKPVIWIHAGSLGEFEQGRPIIEAMRDEIPGVFIVLTFFSPSGYEIRKNYDGAGKILYLPIDTPSNAAFFVREIKPVLAIFIKYEFWFNYLKVLNQNSIPIFFVSAIFRLGQHFFKPWGGWFRAQLRNIDWFFVQHQPSLELLKNIGVSNATVSGDTRFDRVFSIARNARILPAIRSFKNDKKLLVAGSSWPEDEELFINAWLPFSDQLKLIIAPHEVHSERIEKLAASHGYKCIKYSEIDKSVPSEANILIIDSIGILSSIYQYADIVYIGGGFGKGIHNILEAATFGSPIFFGPNYLKFQEAVELIVAGGAFSVTTSAGLESHIKNYLENPEKQNETAKICRDYVASHIGATAIVMAKIKQVLQS